MKEYCHVVMSHQNGKSLGKVFNIRVSLITVLILVSMTILLYSGMFNHSFVNYDDYRIIVNRIDTFSGFTIENLKRIILEDYPREEPLIVRDLSYLINASIFGPLNPKGYLLGNLLLHLTVCYLVYILCLRLFPHQYLQAFMSAFLFSLHPMHVESIAWISSRKDPLYVVFLMTALLAYIRSFDNKSVIRLCVSFFLFCCALFSKSAAISFFPLLVSFRMTLKRSERLTYSELLFFAGVVISTILFVVWYTGVLVDYGVIKKSISIHRDWWIWFLSCCAYITFYIEKLLIPMNLSVLYDYPAPHILFSKSFYVFVSVSVITTILAGLIFLWRKREKQIVFIGLFFMSALLPYLDLAQVNIYVANRYTYLASSAFCMALVYGILCIYRHCYINWTMFRQLIAIIFICYCGFLGFQTVQAIKPWESTLTLWQNANKIASNFPDTYSFIMSEYIQNYMENTKDDKSINALQMSKELGERALAKFCNNSLNTCPVQVNKVVYNLGLIYWLKGDIKRADEFLKTALHLDSSYFTAHYMYTRFLMSQRRLNEARLHVDIIKKNANPNRERNILFELNSNVIPELEKDNRQ